MSKPKDRGQIRLEAKRHTELWIYSFADMYMILSVFFIAISVIYAARAKNMATTEVPTAGRGPAAVRSLVAIEFEAGSAELSEKAQESLKILMPALRSSKGYVEIEGHGDQQAELDEESEFSSNLDLSNARAVRVGEWLMDNGVSSHRVRTYSFGDAHGKEDGDKEIATSRRAILKIVPGEGE
jgi:outer membrane protein OmpA-like peptidoglycan-associated protein